MGKLTVGELFDLLEEYRQLQEKYDSGKIHKNSQNPEAAAQFKRYWELKETLVVHPMFNPNGVIL